MIQKWKKKLKKINKSLKELEEQRIRKGDELGKLHSYDDEYDEVIKEYEDIETQIFSLKELRIKINNLL